MAAKGVSSILEQRGVAETRAAKQAGGSDPGVVGALTEGG
jgi:hypothetical protein